MSIVVDTLFTRTEVMSIRKVGKSKHHADIAAGLFPAPVKIGRRSYFLGSEVKAWLDLHIAERDAQIALKIERKAAA